MSLILVLMAELEQLCVCWKVSFARIREPYISFIMEFLSLMKPQMEHLSFSILLEILLLNWVEKKTKSNESF